jgi:hypothetical protein
MLLGLGFGSNAFDQTDLGCRYGVEWFWVSGLGLNVM